MACICIPARLNSSRLDRKLLFDFEGKTTIELTVEACLKSQLPVYLITDSEEIKNKCSQFPITTILTTEKCINGTERISKHLNQIDDKYHTIINIQADEPFISVENIQFALSKHENNENVFYTTLHQMCYDYNYVKSPACVKVVTDLEDNVLLYSRAVIPSNKTHTLNSGYKTFTGIYVFNRELLKLYHTMDNSPLQLIEDVEQLKILEHGYKIKSFETRETNEISLNTFEDYCYLSKKYYGIEWS